MKKTTERLYATHYKKVKIQILFNLNTFQELPTNIKILLPLILH